jgi:hypothetical protein
MKTRPITYIDLAIFTCCVFVLDWFLRLFFSGAFVPWYGYPAAGVALYIWSGIVFYSARP